MDCNCNNNNTNVIPHVYGNVLSLAIPLTLRTIEVVDGEVEATDTDFIPSSFHPVKVIFSRGTETISLEATMRDGNIACVEDYGTIPIGTYDITVKCKDDQGKPYRFHQKETLAVFNATSEAGITSPIEYEAKTWYLNAAIYLALKGEGGGGTVTAVKMNNGEPISPDGDGVVNLGTVLTRHQDISGKVDKEQGKSLMSDTEHVKLASLPTADALTAALNRIQAAIDALVGEDDVTQAIDTFHEVITFLSGVTNNETLIAKLQELQNAINAKYTKPATGIPASDIEDGVIPNIGNLATKDELDNAIANAGKVKTVTVNGTTHQPDEQTGDVDLGTIQGGNAASGFTVTETATAFVLTVWEGATINETATSITIQQS